MSVAQRFRFPSFQSQRGDVSGNLREYLRSLEERVRRQLLQLVGGDVQPVELLQQGEGPLRDEV